MGRVGRLVFGVLLLFGVARTVAYFVYALFALTTRFETFHLEAKMVLLAQRVQAGTHLYPDWQDYPHVANFFGPVYFVVVGLLGKLVHADLPILFLMGRGVTWASNLAVAGGVVWFLGRTYGRSEALAGGMMSLGSLAMVGYSVMVRPDMMAEMLGFAGFYLSGRSTRTSVLTGGALLVLAILTKQTAAIFLLASALALIFAGEWRRAWKLVAGCLAVLLGVVGLASAAIEPNLARSLLGEMKTPWDFDAWLRTFLRLCRGTPDLLVFPVLGLILWSRGRSRNIRLSTLTAVILITSVVASGKRGADLNYYLSLHVIEALAVGTLWHVAGTVSSRAGRAAVMVAAVMGIVATGPSLWGGVVQAVGGARSASLLAGPVGRSVDRTYRQVLSMASDPKVRVLTDSGLIDLYQKERAAFGDPWLFRLLVETGQIQPRKMQSWIDSQVYDLVVTTSDVFSPAYAQYEFGLPMVLAERVRSRYEPAGFESGLFFYRRLGTNPGNASGPLH